MYVFSINSIFTEQFFWVFPKINWQFLQKINIFEKNLLKKYSKIEVIYICNKNSCLQQNIPKPRFYCIWLFTDWRFHNEEGAAAQRYKFTNMAQIRRKLLAMKIFNASVCDTLVSTHEEDEHMCDLMRYVKELNVRLLIEAVYTFVEKYNDSFLLYSMLQDGIQNMVTKEAFWTTYFLGTIITFGPVFNITSKCSIFLKYHVLSPNCCWFPP